MSENVEKISQDELVLTSNRYFLIFMDGKNQLLRADRTTLNEIYKVIVDLQMPEGSYYIMKGNVVI